MSEDQPEVRYLEIVNWHKYQREIHKRNVKRTWVAMDVGMLTDYAFNKLSVHSQCLFMKMLLLRGNLETNIPLDIEYIGSHTSTRNWLEEGHLEELIRNDFCRITLQCSDASQDKTRQDKTRQDITSGADNMQCAKMGRYARATYTPEFEDFWKVYPRQVGKKKAFQKWTEVMNNPSPPPLGAVMAGAFAYRDHCLAEGTEEKYIKYPQTWLHNDCWEETYSSSRKVKALTLNEVADNEMKRIKNEERDTVCNLLDGYYEAIKTGQVINPGSVAWAQWRHDHSGYGR